MISNSFEKQNALDWKCEYDKSHGTSYSAEICSKNTPSAKFTISKKFAWDNDQRMMLIWALTGIIGDESLNLPIGWAYANEKCTVAMIQKGKSLAENLYINSVSK